jgi:polyhydroxyalkanoate synthesis regulator phasin
LRRHPPSAYEFEGRRKAALLRTIIEGIILLGLCFFLNFETDPKEGEMLDFLKRTIWLGVGLAAMTAEKIEETVRGIVKKGHLSEKEGKELIVDLVEKSKKARKDLGDRVEGMVQDTLKRLKIPTRKEVDELKARIEQLEKALEKKE